jgi:hypothetical protein
MVRKLISVISESARQNTLVAHTKGFTLGARVATKPFYYYLLNHSTFYPRVGRCQQVHP